MWSYCLQEKRFLIFVFFLSLIARLALFFFFLSKDENYLVYFDSAQYQAVAHNIVQGNGIAAADGQSNFYRLPGYPVFLAACYKFFESIYPGHGEGEPGWRASRTMLIQIVISCLIPLLMYCLTLTLVPHEFLLAKVVTVVAAVHLGFVMYSGILATESLFTLFFLVFLIFFFRKQFFLSGFMLGIASLIRPVGHFLLPIILILIFLTHERIGKKIKSSSMFMLAWLSVVGLWLMRNWLLTGMIFFHTLPGLHFLQYTTTKVVMELRSCSYVEARGALLDEWKKNIKEQEVNLRRVLSEPEKCRLAEKITFFYCKQRPLIVMKNCICEMLKTVFGLYSAQMIFTDAQEWSDYSSTSSIWAKLKKYLIPHVNTWYLVPLTWFEIICSLLLLIGFALFCLSMLFNQSARLLAVKIFPFMVVLVGLTCAYGCARLRLPLEPLLVITSLYGLIYFLNRSQKPKE